MFIIFVQLGHLDALSELTSLPCEEPNDCHSIESSYCDFEANLCRCKPDFPVTDSKHCYKGKHTGESLEKNLGNVEPQPWQVFCPDQINSE